jgi:CubicO group peptidase (beta-lactamase class C family)
MKRRWISWRCLALIAALAIRPVWASPSVLDDIVQSAGVPAGTQLDVALFSADGLCHASGYPAMRPGSRATYHSASISKLFTATVVLQLRDEGKLALSDRVGKYVAEMAASSIRISDLLTHTSGLRDRTRARGRSGRAEVDEYIRELSRQKPASEPGAQWAYADAGFNLLGRVIESITGREFTAVMQERVLTPLGMSVSAFVLSPTAEVTSIRAADEQGRPLEHPWDLAFAPSSGLQSDAKDLARFGAEILAIAAGRRDPGLLVQSTLREMTTVRVPTEWSGVSQAYGWQLAAGGEVWRHAGGEAGFESLLALYPQHGFGVAVLGNRKDWPRFKLASAIATAVRDGRLKCGEAGAASS